jgi:DnaK suppressor protein
MATKKKQVATKSNQATVGPVGFTPYPLKKTDSYMDQAQLEHFRSILNLWKQQLMEEVDRTVHHMQDDAGNFPDPLDRASQEEEFNLELRTRDRERKLIKKIDEALERIESGDYGYCDECGAEIGIRRLEARPTAIQCIDCKTFEEIREKQIGG